VDDAKIAENDSERNTDRGREQISFQESTECNHQVLYDRTGQRQLPERHHHLADRRHIKLQLGRRTRAELPEAQQKSEGGPTKPVEFFRGTHQLRI
jgi:hypothetical protein